MLAIAALVLHQCLRMDIFAGANRALGINDKVFVLVDSVLLTGLGPDCSHACAGAGCKGLSRGTLLKALTRLLSTPE